MSTPSISLQDGVAALKQGDYAAAIPPLKAFCESTVPQDSKVYLQANKFLVQAYVKEQQRELALELCIRLAECKVPEVQLWAHQAIPVLEAHLPRFREAIADPEPYDSEPQDAHPEVRLADADEKFDSEEFVPPESASPSSVPQRPSSERPSSEPPSFQSTDDSPVAIDPAEVKALVNQAIAAFRQRNYVQVIELLEPLNRRLDAHAVNDGRVQMTLAKAYQAEGQIEQAREVAEAMMVSDRDDLSIWGKQFFDRLPRLPSQAESEAELDDMPTDASTDTMPLDAPSRPGNAAVQLGASGIAYRPPSQPLPIPAKYQPSAAIAPRDPNDHTAVIQSAVSHGSVTFLFSALFYLLFPDTIAVLLSLLRWAIPIIIYCTATDPIAKENAKQATNYVITVVLIVILSFVGGFFFVLGMAGIGLLSPLLIFLFILPLLAYGLMFSLWPLAGTAICIAHPDKTFHYPKWLVWRAIK